MKTATKKANRLPDEPTKKRKRADVRPTYRERPVGTNEASELIGFSVSWLRKQITLTRNTGKDQGPPFKVVNGRIQYMLSDLLAWVEANTQERRGTRILRNRPVLGDKLGRMFRKDDGTVMYRNEL